MFADGSHSLFCALRPPRGLAQYLWEEFAWLQRGDDRVEPERMHVTLAPLGIWPCHPASVVELVLAICASVQASAFRVVFDDLIVSDRVLLKPSEAIPALCRFQKLLLENLAGAGLRAPKGSAFSPHMTTSYRARAAGPSFIVPASWTVRDFVLIESLIGKRKQIERGRWRLAN